MIAKSVIMITLVGIVLTGIVPLGSLALAAAGKVKSSSFWAGVLAFVIGFLVYTVFGSVVTAVVLTSSGAMNAGNNAVTVTADAASNPVFMASLQAIAGIMLALAMVICINSPMKKTRTLKGAVSCGLGYGASYCVMSLITFITYYSNFASINSGKFDAKYINLVDIGYMTKELIASMKEQYTSITASDLIANILATVLGAAAMVACAIIIMRFICVKKTFAGALTAIVGMAAVFIFPSLMPESIYVGIAISAVVTAALLIFALKVKGDIAPPEAPSYAGDSFMQSVANAKSDNDDIGNVSDFMKSDAKAKSENTDNEDKA